MKHHQKYVGSDTVPTISGGHGGPPYIAKVAFSIKLATLQSSNSLTPETFLNLHSDFN
jgi:hypothetical protein